MFTDRGGYRLNRGDQLEITAKYDNVSGKDLRWGAMGIHIGSFVPDDEASMTSLRRPKKLEAKGSSE